MTDRAKKITELDAITIPAAADLLIIETDPAGNPATKKITVQNLLSSGLMTVSGPYANDAAANSANVAIGKLYYTADGTVKIRLT